MTYYLGLTRGSYLTQMYLFDLRCLYFLYTLSAIPNFHPRKCDECHTCLMIMAYRNVQSLFVITSTSARDSGTQVFFFLYKHLFPKIHGSGLDSRRNAYISPLHKWTQVVHIARVAAN
jgi:hypothetical protein